MKVDQALEMLEDGVRNVMTSDNFRRYLRVMSRFTDYSTANCILIFSQMPTATFVAGYKDWQRNFNRQVRKGARGIRIIAPMRVRKEDEEKEEIRFRVATVFDISSTDGEALPSLGVEELTGSVDRYSHMMRALTELTPIPVRYEEISGGAKGYYNPSTHEIVLKVGMSEMQTVKTCLHEISHFLLHTNDDGKDRRVKEIEAEGCAFTVCSCFGIPTDDYSFSYVASWSSDAELKELKSSLDIIRRTAGKLIKDIKEKLKEEATWS